MKKEERNVHHNPVNWSFFSKSKNILGSPFRNIRKKLNMSRETAGILRYEIEMVWLNLRNKMSFSYRAQLKKTVAQEEIKLNVGCGSDVLDGWVNLDSFPPSLNSEKVLVLDLRAPLPFRNGSVKCIYSEHFMEHLDRYDHGKQMMEEYYRVLKPGGVCRIIVPDTRKVLEAYFDENHPVRLAFPDMKDNWLDWINQMFSSGHKYMYDSNILISDLSEAGFEIVSQCDAEQGSSAEVILDNPDPQRREFSLYVEAIKRQ